MSLLARRRIGRGGFREMTDELQPLALAAGERVDRLTEPQIAEADFLQKLQSGEGTTAGRNGDVVEEEIERVVDGGVEHVRDGPMACAAAKLHFQNVLTIAAAVAFRAADEDVAEELHLDLLEARAATAFALAHAAVEAERAAVQSALFREIGLGEKIADVIEGSDVNDRIRARRLAEWRLIDEHDLADGLVARNGELRDGDGRWRIFLIALVRVHAVGGFGGFDLGDLRFQLRLQRRHQNLAHQRGLAGAADARERDESAQRNLDGKVLEVVTSGVGDAERRTGFQPVPIRQNRVIQREGC